MTTALRSFLPVKVVLVAISDEFYSSAYWKVILVTKS